MLPLLGLLGISSIQVGGVTILSTLGVASRTLLLQKLVGKGMLSLICRTNPRILNLKNVDIFIQLISNLLQEYESESLKKGVLKQLENELRKFEKENNYKMVEEIRNMITSIRKSLGGNIYEGNG